MLRTIEIPGEQLRVKVDIGPGRVVSATLLIDDASSQSTSSARDDVDPFGAELDSLLAATPLVQHFVDDSREAMYTPDDELPRVQR